MNTNLGVAKAAKNDEFYTELFEIQAELKHYKDKFAGKFEENTGMLSKKIDRALRICSVVRDFRPEVEAEMCDGDDIWEEPYARHHLLWIACSEVAAVAGVRAETVSRQFVTGFGEDEDTMMDMMLEFLEAEPDTRQNTRFVKTLYENLGKNDTLDEFKQRLEGI